MVKYLFWAMGMTFCLIYAATEVATKTEFFFGVFCMAVWAIIDAIEDK